MVSEDVRWALQQMGLDLWHGRSRSVPVSALRHKLGDAGRPWAVSIVHALEQEGILTRGRDGLDEVSAAYDALAGHLIADALLSTKNSGELEGIGWQTLLPRVDLFGDPSKRHPLASDVIRALVGLFPRRHYGIHLWRSSRRT